MGSVSKMAGRQSVSVQSGSLSVAFALVAITWCIMLISHPGMVDVRLFETWVAGARSLGLVDQFQRQDSEYGPLSLVIMTGFSFITGGDPFWAVKMSAFVATMISGALVWRFNGSLAVAVGVVLALSVPSIALGFIDVLYMPFLIIMVRNWTLGKIPSGWVAFVVACLIKPSPLLLGPVVALFWLRSLVAHAEGTRLRRASLDLGPALILYLLTLLLFGLDVVLGLWRAVATSHVALSSGAFNLPWLWTILENAARGESDLTIHIHRFDTSQVIGWGFRLAFVLAYLIAMRVLWRGKSARVAELLSSATLAFMAYYMFNLGVHGNHVLLLVGWCFAGVSVGACKMRTLTPLLCVSIAPIVMHYGFFDIASRTLNLDNSVLLAVVVPMVLCLSTIPIVGEMKSGDFRGQ